MKNLKLYCPKSYIDATEIERNYVDGGCGPGKLGDYLVPDKIWGLNIKIACTYHDWMYFVGETYQDKIRADKVFYNNMLRLIESNSRWFFPKCVRRILAHIYYWYVCEYGGEFFQKDYKPIPR